MDKNSSKGEQAFINALLSLMEEKSYNQISVSELSEHAKYDRRTYYRYFSSKDDILFSHCSFLLSEMASKMSKTPLTPGSGFLAFFEFWDNHKDFLKLLYKQNLIYLLGEKLDQLMYRQVGLKVHDNLPEELEQVSEFSRYAYYFTLGGLWQMLVLWIRDGMTLTPQQLTDHVLTSFSEMHKMI